VTVWNKLSNSRTEKFANMNVNVNVRPKSRHFHLFGCLEYVLTRHKERTSKLDSQTRVEIYIGTSPTLVNSVHLVLNPCTELVLSQYHIKFDNLFQTITKINVRFEWKEICHFIILPTFKVQKTINDTTVNAQPMVNQQSLDTNKNSY
jgi:hypothetical protein